MWSCRPFPRHSSSCGSPLSHRQAHLWTAPAPCECGRGPRPAACCGSSVKAPSISGGVGGSGVGLKAGTFQRKREERNSRQERATGDQRWRRSGVPGVWSEWEPWTGGWEAPRGDLGVLGSQRVVRVTRRCRLPQASSVPWGCSLAYISTFTAPQCPVPVSGTHEWKGGGLCTGWGAWEAEVPC